MTSMRLIMTPSSNGLFTTANLARSSPAGSSRHHPQSPSLLPSINCNCQTTTASHDASARHCSHPEACRSLSSSHDSSG
eukprot:scaffold598014_cov33-Prasinocladus_malaysianus.AAC.1